MALSSPSHPHYPLHSPISRLTGLTKTVLPCQSCYLPGYMSVTPCHLPCCTFLLALLLLVLQSVTDKVQKACYCLCYSLLLTKSKLEEVLLGPQEALTSCRQMMKLWKEIHEIEDEEWVTDIDSLFSICAYLHFNSFIPVSYLALLPLIPMFLYAQQSFHSWVFIRKKSVKEGMWVWVICVCKLLVKPWQPIYRCVGKWSQKTMVTLSESLSPGGWHTGANKGDTYPF